MTQVPAAWAKTSASQSSNGATKRKHAWGLVVSGTAPPGRLPVECPGASLSAAEVRSSARPRPNLRQGSLARIATAPQVLGHPPGPPHHTGVLHLHDALTQLAQDAY